MPKDEIDLKTAVDTIAQVNKDFQEFVSASKERDKELLTKGDVDPLLDEKLQKINSAISDQQEIVDKLYAAERKKSITLDGKESSVDEIEQKARDFAVATASACQRPVREITAEQYAEYRKSFGRYLKKGDRILEPHELKALSVGQDQDGGYVVDADTSGRMARRIFETSEIRQYASVQVISTDALEGLYDLDEAGFGWVGETGARTETTTPQLKQWRIPVHEMWAEPRTTQKILDDAGIDIEAWLAGKVADRMIRGENAAFVNGDGIDKPRGFTNYPGGTEYPGQIVRKTTGVNGNFAADPDGFDKLVEMVHTLKAPYRRNGVWAANRKTLEGVRLLKDSEGRMMWQPSPQVGMPSSILGYPIASFEDLPDYTTTDALALWFCDWAEFYQIVDRIGFRVIRDPYTAKPFVKFYTNRRVGGDVVNFEAGVALEFTS